MKTRYISVIFLFLLVLISFNSTFISKLPLSGFLIFAEPNYNFNLDNFSSFQFQPNMRFDSSNISYKIYSCPLQKADEMQRAFKKLANATLLSFYSVEKNEEISIFCENKVEFSNGLFVGGEGGPTNITDTKTYNLISNGKILLLKETQCTQPNIALHELLHALGFAHSINSNNIMYSQTDCNQEIGEDLISQINSLYSLPALPDLALEEVDVLFHNEEYINTTILVRNQGLVVANFSNISIVSSNENIKDILLGPIKPGYGKIVELGNIYIGNANNLSFQIISNFSEGNVSNNYFVWIKK